MTIDSRQCCVDRHHVAADPDPNPTFHFMMPIQIRIWIPDPTPSVIHIAIGIYFLFTPVPVYGTLLPVHLFRNVIGVKIFNIKDSLLNLLEKYSLALHMVEMVDGSGSGSAKMMPIRPDSDPQHLQ
jgi:hypothetical protein